ncbi:MULTISPECIES: type VII secretion integral membrane protein EccD [Gordonia]|uniref:type VII secretion integral membrane protein EccD n=1 Tax=Gordonia TaxID=2053 RepID=UPI0007E9C59C|nr:MULTISPECIES: type VII secretion integral membrane protein EccD [Gordonia]OBC07182.1 type VII secretion integral membrane protein EccD [Gordonia sp. 852002-50395_SCH5434458]
MTSVDTSRMVEGSPVGSGPAGERRAGRTTPIEPALVRVSVLGGNTQLDVGLPAAVPVAVLIGELVTQITARISAQHDPDDPDVDPSTQPPDRQHRWTLALVGQEPLVPNRTLSESGVRDGDLLMLQSVDTGESPVLFDDVVDAVARLNDSVFATWSPLAARYAGYVATLIAALGAAASLSLTRLGGMGSTTALLGGIAALAFLAAAAVVARHFDDAPSATVLSASAMPFAFVAGLLTPPGTFGAAHLALGCALVLLASVVSYRLTAVGPITHSALTTTSTLTGAGAVLTLVAGSGIGVEKVSAVVAAVGLLTVCTASRTTILLTKLPVPPVPTAGAPIDLDVFEPTPAIEGIGAIGAIALPKVDALERRSHLANAYLTGIIGGATAVTAVAACVAAAPLSGFHPIAVAYAIVIGVVLCLRGRSHSDLAQAATQIAGGALTVIVVFVGLAVGDPSPWALIGFGVATALAVVAVIVGRLAAAHDFSPMLRRSAELFEYALLLAVIPLLLWILDLYRLVREF